MKPSSRTDRPLLAEHRDEHWIVQNRRSNMMLFALYLLLAALTSVLLTPAHAATLCTRTDRGIALCAPVETFTAPHWGLGAGASWNAYYKYQPSPWPDFSSPATLVQAFVAANPLAAGCGAVPYLYRGFAYEYRLAGYYNNYYPVTDPMSYADGISPDFGADRQPEEASIWYKWLVPLGGSPGPCVQTIDIIPYQRRVGVCPVGFVFAPPLSLTGSEFVQDPEACVTGLTVDAKNLGACTGPNQIAGNPVSIASGNKFQQEDDVAPGPFGTLGVRRYYNSVRIGSYELGLQWRHTYDRVATPVAIATAGAIAKVSRPDGKQFTFSRAGATWTAERDVADRLLPVVDAGNSLVGWHYVTTSDEIEAYDASGKLQSITARNGMTQTLVYSDVSTPGVPRAGLLIQVADSLGRSIGFAYDAQGRITKVTDQAGQPYLYTYDQAGNLATVTYPDLTQRQYLYNEAAHVQNSNAPWLLTGIVDENGSRFATFSYDAKGRAIATEHAGGVDRYQFSFISTIPAASTLVTDPLGTQRRYDYSYLNSHFSNKALSQPCVTCGGQNARSITYDQNSNPTAITDFKGIKTTYSFDLIRNLEISHTEASGTPQQRTVTTQWHPIYRLPTQIMEPAPGGTRTTTFAYDSSGNLLAKTIVAPRNDGSGLTTSRTWRWTYGTFGRPLTTTDPNGKMTTFTYYSDADANVGKRGNLASTADPVGHITSIVSYDATGRPTGSRDANGLTTTLSYDERGRLTMRKIGIETTAYEYDDVGQPTKVSSPDDSYLQYSYDDAHRLVEVADTLGNSTVYTLDAAGNRVREQVFDPSGNLARSRSRSFTSLSQLASEIGSQTQLTSYTHDVNNNVLTVTDPLGHSTGKTYDALNRLMTVLDPNLGTVRYGYDAADSLLQVTDQRGLNTMYTYDGLNNLTGTQSPDTGTTTSTYDPTGNLLTKIDARGVTASYGYDDVNRVSQIVFRQGSSNETHQFQYDVGSNGKGHLTRTTDGAAITTWTYGAQGRVTSKTQTVDAFTKIATYGYNNAGQLASLTTPSGQRIAYTYINNRVSSILINGQTLLHGAVTVPFGPISSWLWGNGLFTFRKYDQDGRIASWEFRNGVSILGKVQSFDAASRITAINDPNHAAATQTFQYDVLDRITVTQTGSPPTHTQQFAYDAVGNRLNITADGAVTNSAFSANSNQLQVLAGSLSGNYLLGSGTWTFKYGNANRLAMVLSGSTVIATYRVNAMGQRVSKNVGGVIVYFFYDEQGRLLGEYDGSGKLIEETIWLEDLPVATLRPTGATGIPTPVSIYYVHADHLGSTRAVTRPSDNKIMWQWDNLDPFGANLSNENPAGQGIFKYNLRFPGQYYDAEIGVNYNYFRDYDPMIGRYMESDPIGIWGGLGTYSYVANDPLRYLDPTGENIHGNWCGPGGGGPVQDPVDQCCKGHDECYDQCKATWKNKVFGTGGDHMQSEISSCDKKVCACLASVQPKSSVERLGKERVSWFFKCNPAPTANQKPKQPLAKL